MLSAKPTDSMVVRRPSQLQDRRRNTLTRLPPKLLSRILDGSSATRKLRPFLSRFWNVGVDWCMCASCVPGRWERSAWQGRHSDLRPISRLRTGVPFKLSGFNDLPQN